MNLLSKRFLSSEFFLIITVFNQNYFKSISTQQHKSYLSGFLLCANTFSQVYEVTMLCFTFTDPYTVMKKNHNITE